MVLDTLKHLRFRAPREQGNNVGPIALLENPSSTPSPMDLVEYCAGAVFRKVGSVLAFLQGTPECSNMNISGLVALVHSMRCTSPSGTLQLLGELFLDTKQNKQSSGDERYFGSHTVPGLHPPLSLSARLSHLRHDSAGMFDVMVRFGGGGGEPCHVKFRPLRTAFYLTLSHRTTRGV